MKEFYQFAGQHPLLTVALAYVAYLIFFQPFRLANRWIRSRNIKNSGWPPAHLDADGDPLKESE